MDNTTKLFSLHADEAIALYMAGLTIAAMAQDDKQDLALQGPLQAALDKWYQFCCSRGIPVPKPADYIRELIKSKEVPLL